MNQSGVFSDPKPWDFRTDEPSGTIRLFFLVPTLVTARSDQGRPHHLNWNCPSKLAAALANQAWSNVPNSPASGDLASLNTDRNRVLKLREAIDRVNELRPVLEPILRDEGVPVELSAVVLVESGGLTTALSPKGARGVWQFMPDTARRYGLAVDAKHDDQLRSESARSVR